MIYVHYSDVSHFADCQSIYVPYLDVDLLKHFICTGKISEYRTVVYCCRHHIFGFTNDAKFKTDIILSYMEEI
jgi:hypothetical protein